MQVVIGVDGSAESFAAVQFASELLNAGTDQVVLFYSPPEVRIPSAASPSLVERARNAVTEAVFDEARSRLSDGLKANAQTLAGTRKPGRGILLAAEEVNAGLIVVGASGAGTVGSWLLGTVSSEVLDHAKVPVLTVRPSQPHTEPGLRVLIAYDGSKGSQLAADTLTRLTWPVGSQACVVSVVEPAFADEMPGWMTHKVRSAEVEEMTRIWADEHDQEMRNRGEEIARLSQQLPAPLTGAETQIIEGDAAEKILALARERQVDLLVIGARGQGAWERMLLGSTATRLVEHAPCSVLVVRERETP
ncbi:MAG: universal stress protein [Pirellulales bacterium]